MLTLENILEEWKKDNVIDEFALDDASLKTPKLHSKYVEFLSLSKLQKHKREMELKTLLKDKWLYYNGKLDKQTIDKYNWNYDPFDGISKPLKSDMDYWYDSDKDIQKLVSQIEYWKVMVETLSDIVQHITWRHQNISNIIKWRTFTSGG